MSYANKAKQVRVILMMVICEKGLSSQMVGINLDYNKSYQIKKCE